MSPPAVKQSYNGPHAALGGTEPDRTSLRCARLVCGEKTQPPRRHRNDCCYARHQPSVARPGGSTRATLRSHNRRRARGRVDRRRLGAWQEALVRAQPAPEKTCESWKNRSRSAKETVSHETNRRDRRRLLSARNGRETSLAAPQVDQTQRVCPSGSAGPLPRLRRLENLTHLSAKLLLQ